MTMPEFSAEGDLPSGVYRVKIDEVLHRFGSGTALRRQAGEKLKRVIELAGNTGHLDRAIVFGSFVTAKPSPNDVDVVLVMDDDFRLEQCDVKTASLFDHMRAQQEHGASVFWIRPSLLIQDTLPEFINRWQLKREGGQRGILEVMND
jgi:hypothetical protein